MSIIEKVQKWANLIGRNEAHIRLIRAGLSPSIAWKICSGAYDHELNPLTAKAIDEAMKLKKAV